MSEPDRSAGRRMPPKSLLGALLAALALAGLLISLAHGAARTHVTATFPEAVAVYPGDQVRVVGVPVGTIDSITPTSTGVAVSFSFDSSVPVPSEAKAVLVSPSLVSTRYIQLVPAYRGGDRLADGAVIPASRTATPVEFDQIKAELTQLVGDLGPMRTESTGALGRGLNTLTDNLGGQGSKLHDSITRMSRAATTLAGADNDLFGTVRNLHDFVAALNDGDEQMRGFLNQLNGFSGVLHDDADNVSAALDGLDSALSKVRSFVADNRSNVNRNVDALRELTGNLAKDRQRFADLAQTAPVALSNVYNAYDPVIGGIHGMFTDPALQSPAATLCAAGFELGGSIEQCQKLVGPLADLFRMDHVPGSPQLRPLMQRNIGGPSPTPSPALAPAPSLPGLLTGTR